jgi:hypothetical protein
MTTFCFGFYIAFPQIIGNPSYYVTYNRTPSTFSYIYIYIFIIALNIKYDEKSETADFIMSEKKDFFSYNA